MGLFKWPKICDYDLSYQSPRYSASKNQGIWVAVALDRVSKDALCLFETHEINGSSIAGAYKKFVCTQAKT